MREITKEYLRELFALHDKGADAITATGTTLLLGKDQAGKSLIDHVNDAGYWSDQLETKFAEALTPEERGVLPDEKLFEK